MSEYVFKHHRKKDGKLVEARYYSGRYRLAGDLKRTFVALHTTDKQVAKAKLRQIVRDVEQERAGLLAPKAIREGLQMPLADLVKEYVNELHRLGRNQKYVEGLG